MRHHIGWIYAHRAVLWNFSTVARKSALELCQSTWYCLANSRRADEHDTEAEKQNCVVASHFISNLWNIWLFAVAYIKTNLLCVLYNNVDID